MAGLDGVLESRQEHWVRNRVNGGTRLFLIALRLDYVGCSIDLLLYRKKKGSTIENIQHIYIGT